VNWRPGGAGALAKEKNRLDRSTDVNVTGGGTTSCGPSVWVYLPSGQQTKSCAKLERKWIFF